MITLHPAFARTDVISGITTADHDARDLRPLAIALGVDPSTVHTVKQVHGATVHHVTTVTAQPPVEADALITDLQGVILGVRVADCGGVLLIDPSHHAVAAVHSGWRGTHQNILRATMERMRDTFGTRPDDLLAWISPCASGDRYEVRHDVASLFPEFVRQNSPGIWLFDNKKALVHQFLTAGGSHEHVTVDPACTMTDARFHSHRRDGELAGRCLAFIGTPKTP